MDEAASSRADRGRVHIPEDVAGFGGARAHLKAASASRLALEQSRNRLTVTASLFALCFLVLCGRLLYLGFVAEEGPRSARAAAAAHRPLARADIVDRNGVILATNLVTASLYADTRNIPDPQMSARRLVSVLPDLDYRIVLDRLKSGHAFIWLKRNLTPQQQQSVNNLGIPGLSFMDEPHRVYPQGRLCAHVLGFVDIDDNGIAGAEKRFNALLRNADNRPLSLALDVRVQHIVRDELAASVSDFEAIGATGIVLDVHTGEVLAMVSLPDFDPNEPGTASADTRFNRATLGVYEMGSTFKTFTLAMALDYGVSRLGSVYDATNPIQIGRFRITDYHPQARPLTLPEIFMYSSNIGAAKVALDVGGERQQLFLKKLGMLSRSPIELPEVGEPLVPSPWREVNTLTIGFGHGLAVTPIQMASGVASIINGGHLVRPSLLLGGSGTKSLDAQAVRSQTSTMMRGLMRLVVERGTGTMADVEGYSVGGKTGTAEKAAAGGYRRKALLTSFVSIFPSSEPRYLVLAMLDEPKPTKKTHGFATAGWTAAPTAGRIIERIAPLLGVPPLPKDEETKTPRVLVSLER